MNILITNDDGIGAEGIDALYDEFSREHNVFIIAPHEEKSGSSNAITIYRELKVEKRDGHHLAVHGFPADCVNFGLNGGLIPKPDMVISGINHGANLGDDVYYSGTVGAARVGFIFGCSAIAVSVCSHGASAHFKDAAGFVAEMVRSAEYFPPDCTRFYNVNHPDIARKDINGIKHTQLGKRTYCDYYKIIEETENGLSAKLGGTISSSQNDEDDTTAVDNGFISVTPITLDSTDHTWLHSIKKLDRHDSN